VVLNVTQLGAAEGGSWTYKLEVTFLQDKQVLEGEETVTVTLLK